MAAEKRGDAVAALASYDLSCEAGFQVGGCYDAGKIYFLNRALRDYRAAEKRMARVCSSDDVGSGPYACKYLGIIYRNGLTAKAQPDRAFATLSRACFFHNDGPFIDGNGCEILADSVPSADAIAVDASVWHRDYIAYLALVMGCTDDMPALCTKAQALHRRALASSAKWVRICAEDVRNSAHLHSCADLPKSALAAGYDTRQTLRRQLVRLFNGATEFSG
ncbi:hypothetical protein ACG3SL_14030 [Sphingomonas sp. CJ20]